MNEQFLETRNVMIAELKALRDEPGNIVKDTKLESNKLIIWANNRANKLIQDAMIDAQKIITKSRQEASEMIEKAINTDFFVRTQKYLIDIPYQCPGIKNLSRD